MVQHPHSPLNERRVLNRILSNQDGILDYPNLKGKFFSDEARQNIFNTVRRWHSEGRQIDFTSLFDHFNDHDKVVIELKNINNVGTDVTPQKKTEMLRELYVQRKLQELAGKLEAKAKDDNCYSWALDELLQMEGVSTGNLVSAYESVNKLIRQMEEEKKRGLKTELQSVDRLLNGYQPGRMYIVAGRPGMGKTSLLTTLLLDFVDKNYQGVFITLEMPDTEIMKRLISAKTGISSNSIPSMREDKDVKQAMEKMMNEKFYISSTLDTTNKIYSACHRLKAKHELDFILVDYLQLLADKESHHVTNNSRVSYISRRLKYISRKLEVPIVVGCQLNRRVERREDKHPVLSDLRDSGSIEQDADVVLSLFRPAYYDDDKDDSETHLEILKNRSGIAGIRTKLIFKPKTTKFVAMEEKHEPVGEGVEDSPSEEQIPF